MKFFDTFGKISPILGKKVSLSDDIRISYVVSTYRTWWSFLILSAKFPQILGKKVSLSDDIRISYVVSTYRTWWSFLILSAKFPQILGEKVSLSDNIYRTGIPDVFLTALAKFTQIYTFFSPNHEDVDE